MILTEGKRIVIVGGHYGSGKSEFCLNLALSLKAAGRKVAIIDLDLVNPYFRSREKSDYLLEFGIPVYGSSYKTEITMEVPALGVNTRVPLEDPETTSIIDLGGNSAGALVSVQFIRYFRTGAYDFLCVINRNRPETATLEGALHQINDIQDRTGLNFTGLINNTHLLRETSLADLEKGLNLCDAVTEKTALPTEFTDCPDFLLDALKNSPLRKRITHEIMPIRFLLRSTWLDQKI